MNCTNFSLEREVVFTASMCGYVLLLGLFRICVLSTKPQTLNVEREQPFEHIVHADFSSVVVCDHDVEMTLRQSDSY